ncbi:hypothetical protein H4R18_005882 [Coemansia javaensis]|uniref:Uncharacterized protein n=1 Tax=Coemansia javaensis TaxID=2761396 RepID=A0A9W8LEP7_9FUNG|nr:hypothetical protein H4R18_005882 [Coemansia javaensis]
MLLKTCLHSAAAALAMLGVFTAPVRGNESDCVSSFDATADYFPDKVESKYGSGFNITYTGNAKYIRNNISGETYVLYQCGTPVPADARATPADSLQVGNWTKVAAVPGARIVLDSAPASAALELLGLQDVVAASYHNFVVTSACMQKRLASLPRIQQRFDTTNRRRRRRSAGLVPRVAYDLADTNLQWTFTTYGMNDQRSFAVNPEGASDMLGKAEWIKFVAAFFNKEAEANKIFADIESRYASTKKSLAATTGKTLGIARYNKMANGTIAGWTIEKPEQWAVAGLADAGVAAFTDGPASFSSTGRFFDATSRWDILIDRSAEPLLHGGAVLPEWSNLVAGYGFNSSSSSSAAPAYLAAKAVYRSDRISSYQNATDYDEHLQIRPDLLLEDYGHLAAAASGATNTTWYRNMPLGIRVNWVSADDC